MHTLCDVRRVSPESANCVYACLCMYLHACSVFWLMLLFSLMSFFFMFVCIVVPISVFMSVSDAGV